MKVKKNLIWMPMVAIALGFSVLAAPQAASAQTDPPKQEREDDDDDDDDEKLTDADKRQVKVSIESARAIALNRVAGKVIDEELEKERGRLQYAFDIKTPDGKIYDVEISAVTGEVLQAEEEDDDDEDDGEGTRKSKIVKKQKVVKTARLVKTKP